MDVTIIINGLSRQLTCEPHTNLRTLLRSEGFFGVRFGSDSGETGAAAVLLDGRLVSADVVLGAQADGHEVTTVEALNRATGELHPIQAAFLATGAMQSGYSVPAMILGTLALLRGNPSPSEFEVRDMLSGILDRETAFVKPVEAVLRAAALLRGDTPGPFRPEIVIPLTDGRNPAPVGATETAPVTASPAVPGRPWTE